MENTAKEGDELAG